MAAAGTLRLTLTGGEILTRRDFFVIAERARALGFALDLKTNGTLITPERADRLAALHPIQVDISLLGATTETSDAVMRGRNTLPRILAGVRLLQERGVRVKLNSLLLDLNLAEREQMLALALRAGRLLRAGLQDVARGRRHAGGRGGRAPVVAGADDPHAGGRRLAVHAADRRRRPRARAASGSPSCLISPYGVVYPCIELRIPAGRLAGQRRQRFAEIWAGAPIFNQLRFQHTYNNLPECRVCPINAYCEGRCSGLAWKDHGDPYGGHALACQHAQARYAQQHPGEPIPETPLQARLAGRPAVSQEERGQPIHLFD